MKPKMILISLTLVGFRKNYTIEFRKGFNLISGHTSTGKTSILEMIDYLGYQLSVEDKDFLDEIRCALSNEYLNEVHLSYKGINFSIEPVMGKVVVFLRDEKQEFNCVEEVFLNFKINGKPFIEVVSDIDYSD